MHRIRLLLSSAVFAIIIALSGGEAVAQDPLSGPAPTPVPNTANPHGLPDIESLREVGSTSSLIPAAPTPNPLTALPPSGGNSNNRQGGGGLLGGGHRRSTRASDLTAGQADADPLAVRVAYRRAKTEAVRRDPDLTALWQQAATSGTEPQKRIYLKEYYTRLFASIRLIDPSPAMKTHVDLLAQVASQHYAPQRRTVGGEEDLVRGEGSGRRGRAR